MATKTDTITLEPLKKETLRVQIKGASPLIVHAWSEKARKMMLDKQMGLPTPKKAVKDPIADYEASMYRLPDGSHGFPATAFKAAIVGAARKFDGITMTALRGALFLLGDGPDQLVRISGEPTMREDMVRVGMGTADIRHRAMYADWSAVLVVRYFPSMLTDEAILALVDAAGAGGIGEWRPEKSDTGMFGTFEVVGLA